MDSELEDEPPPNWLTKVETATRGLIVGPCENACNACNPASYFGHYFGS